MISILQALLLKIMEVADVSGNDNASCKECCGYLLAKLSDKKPKVTHRSLPSFPPYLLPPSLPLARHPALPYALSL